MATTNQADQITVDADAYSETDSNYGTSQYSTESLSSSIYQHRFENGRRYHAYRDGKYALPNDETEQDRLDVVHHLCLLMLGNKLHLAPIENPQSILDIGTGTGIWAIDAGETYPSAVVTGTDLSPIQPNWVPPNVSFQIDDAESVWTWPENHFDFIHIRHMTGAIEDWPALIKQAYKHVKPGGWVELNEFHLRLFSDDGSLKPEMYISKFYDLIGDAAAQAGRPFSIAPLMRPFFEEAGFENIEDRVLKLPLGTWPADKAQKEMGAYFLLTAQTGFEAFGMAFLTRVLKMTPEEVGVVVEGAKRDAKNRSIHSYCRQYIYYGQKPECD